MTRAAAAIRVPHIVRGHVVWGDHVVHCTRLGEQFVHPALDLDAVVVPHGQCGPAFDTPVAEVIDFLAETGKALDFAQNTHLAEAAETMSAVSPHSARLVEATYRQLSDFFDPAALWAAVNAEIGAPYLDGWVTRRGNGVPRARVRAFPCRLVHIMPGNGPGGAAMTIARGALTKGINLLKLPSNDLCTAVAILRTMADIDADHPILKSFSAVYWRGGDSDVESVIFRPQFFDKVVAWGGAQTIRNVTPYLGPGIELVAYDPKVSISLIGREAFADEDTLRTVANRGADDAAVMNQEACVASRHQFVEGDLDEVDRYCELLAAELSRERQWADGRSWRTPPDVRSQVEVLRFTPDFRMWGDFNGSGLVVRSTEPVEFHPSAKTVNVVPVRTLDDALAHATVATQTVGVFPPERKTALRDRLASNGVQRIVSLGNAIGLASGAGLPHDGSFPLQRLVRWVSDEDLELAEVTEADGLDD